MEKINVAELLKDCPHGIELDCVLFNNPVRYDGLNNDDIYPITILTENDDYLYLTEEGYLYNMPNSKCVIFPKGKTTWEGFVSPCQFKDVDILITARGNPFILKKIHNDKICESYCGIRQSGEFIVESYNWTSNYNLRFATEEEKQKLFQAVKENGYKWHEETKTLEKLPKFKVGDRIRHKCENFRDARTIISYGKSGYWTSINDWIDYENQDDWELVPNKFDISTLKAFDKVLVRLTKDGVWNATFFSHYDKEVKWGCYPFVTTSSKSYSMCIPYEQNKHLLGTNNDCDEYYKTW